jgi:hypothetical protein
LFFQPLTTSALPASIASNPSLATTAGSSLVSTPTLVSIRSARSKNSVSVAPGIRHVTVTPESGAKGPASTRDEPVIDLDDTDPDVAGELDKDGKRPPKL